MGEVYVDLDRCPEAADLANRQAGVATRAELCASGLSPHRIGCQVAGRRWTAVTSQVILLHNHTPTRLQWMWIAIKDADPVAALASHSALERAGFKGFAEEALPIHLVVPRGAKTSNLPNVTVHESRRFLPEHIRSYSSTPCTEVNRSAVDAGAWQPWPRFAVAIMAAVVQQRVCTVPSLHQALDEVGKVRHRKIMRLALHDVGGGAEALSEIDIARMCRRFGLMAPRRQRVRRDRSGRKRFLDCEWDLPDGTVLVLEVDGAHHMEVAHWDDDIKRQRKVVARHRHLLRATAMQARFEQADLVADLVAMGVPRHF